MVSPCPIFLGHSDRLLFAALEVRILFFCPFRDVGIRMNAMAEVQLTNYLMVLGHKRDYWNTNRKPKTPLLKPGSSLAGEPMLTPYHAQASAFEDAWSQYWR